ncbi:MAG TPA: cyanophycinase [Rhodanobacteraceae bacterium]|nr:cyanophycinase [Rhodanobacteraceae bacterium]
MQLLESRTRHPLTAWLIVAMLLAGLCGAARARADGTGYQYFSIGNVSAPTPAKTSPGLLLMGGGREIEAAFKWFVRKAGHGHIVIIRASGDAALQDWIYRDVGDVESVQTLIFHSRATASDPRVLGIIRHADGIFIAGGDQSNYVRFWKDTPLGKLLNEHVRLGKPIGGTSAGLAILGQWGYGAMDGGSITSPEALRDPAGPAVTLVDHFISIPLLEGTITDTHFAQRSRLGRLLAFVARIAKDHRTAAVTGLGVDQDSALLVEADGSARLLSWHPDGHAWVVVPEALRKVDRAGGRAALDRYLKNRVVPGKPLDLPGYLVIGIGTGSRVDLPDYKVTDPAFRRWIDAVDGRLVEHDAAPAGADHASRSDLVDGTAAQP